MALTLKTAPSEAILDLADVKAHLRVDTTADDALIGALITAASQRVDGPLGTLGRALVTQTWTWSLDRFPFHPDRARQSVRVPLPTLQTVNSIRYIDTDGNTQTLDPSLYLVDIASEPGRLAPAYRTCWPLARCIPNAVTIEFSAGYANAAAVPQLIKQAMLLLIGAWYENRDAISAEFPPIVDELLSAFRILSY